MNSAASPKIFNSICFKGWRVAGWKIYFTHCVNNASNTHAHTLATRGLQSVLRTDIMRVCVCVCVCVCSPIRIVSIDRFIVNI